MTKHSEGPWRFEAQHHRAGHGIEGHILPADATAVDDPCVAYVEGVGSVDLALMLAGPELLAAAELGLWLMERVADWDGEGEPITRHAAIMHGNEIRAAIGKAKAEVSL